VTPILLRIILVVGLALVACAIVLTRRAWLPGIGHGLPSIWRIAKITVAEARRRRVLQAVIALVILILLSMTAFSYLSPQEQAKMVIDGGLAAITVFGILLAIFVAAFLIPNEVENRTVYAILAKPVRRSEFVLGKYLGALIVLAAMVAVMTVVLVGVLVALDHLIKDQAASSFNPNLGGVVLAAVMSYCSLAVLTALIVLISTVSSTTMTVIAALIIWAVGSLQSQIYVLAEGNGGAAKLFLLVLYYLVPHLENFDYRFQAANFVAISVPSAIGAVIVGIGYTVVVLVVASIFFSDRQV
jgi:ABC-type transport system involved in multi-copper enzyme maturation permease subunit